LVVHESRFLPGADLLVVAAAVLLLATMSAVALYGLPEPAGSRALWADRHVPSP
jgi:hypothetical protein